MASSNWRCCSPEVGWSVAPVPVYATLVLGADPIARHGSARQRQRHLPDVVNGNRLLTAALAEPGRSDPTAPATTARRDRDTWRIDGSKDLVPAAQVAHAMLIPAAVDDGDVGLFVIDLTAPGVEVRPARTTDGQPHADVFLDGASVSGDDRLAGDGAEMIRSLHARALVGLCATQLGVTERALRIAAAYTTEREQFGRPIGSFQAVQQRMADVFIDVEAIRWTMWQAAWLLAQDRPAAREAGIAKFWAAEAGARARRDRPASPRRNRNRHHLSPVPLLPVGQAERVRARFGRAAVGPARRAYAEGEPMTATDLPHHDPGLARHQRRRRGDPTRDPRHHNRDRRRRDRIT